MTLNLFDTHAHLNIDPLDQMIEEVVERSKSSGVTGIAVIGIDVATSQLRVRTCRSVPRFSIMPLSEFSRTQPPKRHPMTFE